MFTDGNPTCEYCGVTYPMIERHDCVFSREAKLKVEKERADKAEKELKAAKITLRDQFAMAALSGLCGLNWRTKETPNPTAKDHAEQAYRYADAMLEFRKQSAE